MSQTPDLAVRAGVIVGIIIFILAIVFVAALGYGILQVLFAVAEALREAN